MRQKRRTTKKLDVAASKYADLVKEIEVLTRRVKVMEDRKGQPRNLPFMGGEVIS